MTNNDNETERDEPFVSRQSLSTQRREAHPLTVAAANTPMAGPVELASLPVELSAEVLEENRIIAMLRRNPLADKFRMLRTQVLQIMSQSGYRTLAITSPNYGDGKSTIAINLALSIALDLKQTVLIADLDLRKPGLAPYLGLDARYGLTDYLIDDVPLTDCIVRLAYDRICALPAGRAIDHSSEILGSPKMADLSQELKTRYPDRLVIYDMPPVLEQDDPIAFMPYVDAALLVVRDTVTQSAAVTQSLDALQGAHVIGTVLNDNGYWGF